MFHLEFTNAKDTTEQIWLEVGKIRKIEKIAANNLAKERCAVYYKKKTFLVAHSYDEVLNRLTLVGWNPSDKKILRVDLLQKQEKILQLEKEAGHFQKRIEFEQGKYKELKLKSDSLSALHDARLTYVLELQSENQKLQEQIEVQRETILALTNPGTDLDSSRFNSTIRDYSRIQKDLEAVIKQQEITINDLNNSLKAAELLEKARESQDGSMIILKTTESPDKISVDPANVLLESGGDNYCTLITQDRRYQIAYSIEEATEILNGSPALREYQKEMIELAKRVPNYWLVDAKIRRGGVGAAVAQAELINKHFGCDPAKNNPDEG
jgi:hypothetical protein